MSNIRLQEIKPPLSHLLQSVSTGPPFHKKKKNSAYVCIPMDILVKEISVLDSLCCHFYKQDICEKSATIKLVQIYIQWAHVLTSFSTNSYLHLLIFKNLKQEQTQENESTDKCIAEPPKILLEKHLRYVRVKQQISGK